MFKKTLLKAIEQVDADRPLKGKQRIAANSARNENHPLLWRALENKMAREYEREHDQTVAQAGGWQQLLDWLVENLPAILKLIMTLFGGL